MVNLNVFKGVMIIIIFCSGLTGVLSPRLFRPYGSRLSYASLFSSGILLSASMVHLLGDASESLSQSPLPDFPWAYFLCGLSFYLLYFFERFFIHLLAHTHDHNHKDEKQQALLTQQEVDKYIDSISARSKSIFEDPLFDDHGEDILRLMQHKNNLAGFVLLMGLGLHSFLAGIGFGSSLDMDQAFALAIAIVSHKYLAAFALGCPFYQSGAPLKQHIIIAFSFSSISPLGVVLGWVLSDGMESWMSNIFVSIAAGTFIYVAVIEILVPEFSETKQKEKLILKTHKKIESMNLENRNIGRKTRAGIKEDVKNEVTLRAEKNSNRVEAIKSLSVLSGFILMSLLAIWV